MKLELQDNTNYTTTRRASVDEQPFEYGRIELDSSNPARIVHSISRRR